MGEKSPSARPEPEREPERSPEDDALLDRLAELTVRHRMTVPAIFFLESVKPLSFVGSQALYFFEPMVRAFFSVQDYDRFARMMERRDTFEALLRRIERRDDDERLKEQERRDREKTERAEGKRRKGTQ